MQRGEDRTGWTPVSNVGEGSIRVAGGPLASIRRSGGRLFIHLSSSLHILQSHGGANVWE